MCVYVFLERGAPWKGGWATRRTGGGVGLARSLRRQGVAPEPSAASELPRIVAPGSEVPAHLADRRGPPQSPCRARPHCDGALPVSCSGALLGRKMSGRAPFGPPSSVAGRAVSDPERARAPDAAHSPTAPKHAPSIAPEDHAGISKTSPIPDKPSRCQGPRAWRAAE